MQHIEKSVQRIPTEWLSETSLKEICLEKGPFITVLLPAHHQGDPELSRPKDFAEIVQNAEAELRARRHLGNVDKLLEPLRELERVGVREDTGSSVMYLSPAGARRFQLVGTVRERVVAASFPHVTPIISDLGLMGDCYVLALAKGRLRLGRWHEGKCTEESLPEGIPLSFEDTLISSRPDHDIQSRASTTRFGTGTQRESTSEQLHQYFQIVDRKMTDRLHGVPLVVIGIDRELTEYRRAATYPHVLYAKPTSPEHHSWSELGEIALEARRESLGDATGKALVEFREFPRRDQIEEDLRAVLEAAREGRIHRLLIERNAEEQGLLGPAFPLNDERLEGEHDLINAAVVETIRAGGRVQTVNDGQLGKSRVGAILRYAAAECAS